MCNFRINLTVFQRRGLVLEPGVLGAAGARIQLGHVEVGNKWVAKEGQIGKYLGAERKKTLLLTLLFIFGQYLISVLRCSPHSSDVWFSFITFARTRIRPR